MPWQKTLNPLSANDEEKTLPAGSKMLGSLAPNLTWTGAVFSNASDREAPMGPVEDFRADPVLNSMNYSTSNYPFNVNKLRTKKTQGYV